MKYIDKINNLKKEYFKVLGEYPFFLNDYIETKEMQKQDGISVTCGTFYSNMFSDKIWWSSLDHSVAVAIIIWNFTHDKKQTLSGLFHDIATPTFKHTIDFMNNDAETQESTESLTKDIIKNSEEISNLLNRDSIDLKDVCDYHIYPIADNDSPKLSSDRLEYTLSNGLGATKKVTNIDEVRKIYSNIIIGHNEEGEIELAFTDIDIAYKFMSIMGELSSTYINPKHKFSMQFLADIVLLMIKNGYLSVSDLYKISDEDLIKKIENCNYGNISKVYEMWKNSEDVFESDEKVPNRYLVSVNPKIRYIDPLVKTNNGYERMSNVYEPAKRIIEKAKGYKTKKYIYSNFEL